MCRAIYFKEWWRTGMRCQGVVMEADTIVEFKKFLDWQMDM